MQQSRQQVTFLGVTTVAAVMAVYLSFVLASPLGLGRVASLMVCSLIILVALRSILRAIQGGPADIWQPRSYVSAFYLLYFGLGPVPALWWTYALHEPNATAAYALGLFLALVGLVALQWGCQATPRRLSAGRRSLPPVLWDRRATVTVLVGLLMLLWWERLRLSSVGVFFKGSAVIGDLGRLDRMFVVSHLNLSLLLTGLAAYCRYWLGARRGLVGTMCAAAIVGEAGYWFLANARVYVLLVAVSAAIVASMGGSRVKPKVIVLLAAVFLGAVYPLGGVMRGVHGELRYEREQVSSIGGVARQVMPRAVSRLERDYVGWFTSPQERDYQSVRLNGANMLAAVLYQHLFRGEPLLNGEVVTYGAPMNVPRLLWPGKPDHELDVEGFINYHFGLPVIDTMITPPTEFYADFGLGGLVVGMVLWGALLGAVFWFLIVRSTSTVGVLTYAATITSLVWIEQSFIAGVLGSLRNGLVLWGVLCVVDRIIALSGHRMRAQRLPRHHGAREPAVAARPSPSVLVAPVRT